MTCISNNIIEGFKPAFLMVLVRFLYAGVSILYKLVANNGMSMSVLLAYRYLFSSAFMIPLAYFAERKSKPKITMKVLFQAFLCGLFGATIQENLFVEAVTWAGATYPSAMLERLNIETKTGKAKVVGTLIGISGAMILTFYKSIEIHLWPTIVNQSKPKDVATGHVWGTSLAFGTCISYSIWLIIQARMSAKFPWHYTSAALMSVMACIQSTIFALGMERDNWSQWKLGWNIELLTALYTGVVASGVVWVLMAWCLRLKGPLYASAFNPLLLVIVAIAGSLFLEEKLYLGSIIGSILIVLGLYIVLWGKGKELKSHMEQKHKNDSVEVEPLEIVTTKQIDGKNVDIDGNDLKCGTS
ncbi:WAT1-related protein At1g25270-like isoform X2 [Lotus japonicus]|uniref:WAT1-related protein At1g25270-like isoform X2 n=1 Tax=Lotus japonicus TaxID=34305 RepID=UPI00258D46DD|nr:WAT1-related protein At1g25270-like isoform X2 [Lotus japonicus]